MDFPLTSKAQSPDWRYTHTAAPLPTSVASVANPPNDHPSDGFKSPRTLHPLPPLDLAKLKRNYHDENEPNHPSPLTTTASPFPPINSPAGGYPGPPPPYSSITTTTSIQATIGPAAYHTQPAQPQPMQSSLHHSLDFQRPQEEIKERQPFKSLPSIHEALRKEPGTLYRPHPIQTTNITPSTAQASITPSLTPLHHSHDNSPSSFRSTHYDPTRQTEPSPRAVEPPPPPPPPQRPTIDTFQAEPRYQEPRRYSGETLSAYRSSENLTNHPRPVPTIQPSSTSSYFPQTAPQPSYTTSFPPAYSYPPPSNHGNHQSPVGGWRGPEFPRTDYPPEEERKAPIASNTSSSGRQSPGGPYHHGESVKRHLETFDLELGLNELAQTSSQTLDFARRYVDKAHHMQRSGIATALPTLAECDDMYKLQKAALNSVERIREIVVAQQHALAEQRSREEASKARQAAFGEQSSLEKDEGSGGFAGPDPKKRRGRHAPPGRCHSCARSETPEWRRGPDGARTLCNACGLHYAKLTRKLGPKAPLPGSSLRPKDDDASSP